MNFLTCFLYFLTYFRQVDVFYLPTVLYYLNVNGFFLYFVSSIPDVPFSIVTSDLSYYVYYFKGTVFFFMSRFFSLIPSVSRLNSFVSCHNCRTFFSLHVVVIRNNNFFCPSIVSNFRRTSFILFHTSRLEKYEDFYHAMSHTEVCGILPNIEDVSANTVITVYYVANNNFEATNYFYTLNNSTLSFEDNFNYGKERSSYPVTFLSNSRSRAYGNFCFSTRAIYFTFKANFLSRTTNYPFYKCIKALTVTVAFISVRSLPNISKKILVISLYVCSRTLNLLAVLFLYFLFDTHYVISSDLLD